MLTDACAAPRHEPPPPGLRLVLSAYPCRLPHVTLDGGRVYFGGVEDLDAGGAEARFLALADGRTPFGEILAAAPETLGGAATSRHAVWLPRALELPAPAAVLGPRVLLLGAHPGDVALSMGGLVLARGAQARFVEICCFSRQSTTRMPHAFAGAAAVTAVRRDESHLAAAASGMEIRLLDFPEQAPRPAGGGPAAERLDLPPAELAAAVRIALYDAIADLAPDQVFAPAALGHHPDPRLLFDIAVELFERDVFPGTAYHLYANAPLAAAHLHIDDFLSRFEGAYLHPEPWWQEIGAVLPQKLLLGEIFRSRFDLALRPLLWATARRDAVLSGLAAPGAAAERFWTLRDSAVYA